MAGESITEKLAAAKDRAAAKTAARIRPQATRLSESTPVKVALFGPIASGKTKFLEGPLLCGERVLNLSTDFGGNGLLTVKNGLRKAGRADVLGNLLNLDLAAYEDVIEFLDNPTAYVPDIADFDPTVFAWDGFTTFQVDYLDEYSDRFPDKVAALKTDKWGHWYDVKRSTSRVFKKFFGLTFTGKPLHKVMTLIEAKPDVNDLTQVTEKAPMIQGGAKDLCTGGFDVVLNCYSEEDKTSGEVKFFYRTRAASGKYAVKNRDFALKPVEEANPERVWRLLTGKDGL